MADMAREIRERSRALGKDPASRTVYVGEVGVLAYELLDARVIDRSGINLREVFELRRWDQERLRREEPGRPWFAHRLPAPRGRRRAVRRGSRSRR